MSGSILGNAVLRKEDPGLLRGTNRFYDDLEIEGLLHAVLVRSTIAHADIVELDTSDARSMPGVVAVHTSETLEMPDSPALFTDPGTARPHLAKGRVRFVGDIVAIVVATSQSAARDAAEAVIVDYKPLDPVTDLETAAEDGSPLVWEHTDSNVVFETTHQWDTDPLAGADVVVGERIASQRLAGVPLETNGCVAVPDGENMTVWVPSQNAIAIKDMIAPMGGVEAERLRVVAPWVGGGFGNKSGYYPEFGLVTRLAADLGRPVKWASTRSEDMVALTQGRGFVSRVEMGINRDGKIVGMRADVLAHTGAYPAVGTVLPTATQMMAQAVYDIPTIAFRARCVSTNTTSIAAYRGAGRPEATQMVERILDVAAGAIGMDPAEVRRVNFIPPEAFPLTTRTGAAYDSGEYELALDAALEASGYSDLRAEQARRREAGDTKLLGIGVSAYVEITALFGLHTEWGKVEVNDDGSATMYVGTSAHGQGHDTAFSMIVSDALGIAMDKITLIQSDTNTIPSGQGTMASRSLQTAGSAVKVASDEVLDKAKQLASHLLEADEADIVVGDGGLQVVGVPATTLSWAELKAASDDNSKRPEDMEAGLAHELMFDGTGSTFPFGAHVSVVEVDTETGGIEMLRHVAVDDCGTILNPLLVTGQQHGGIAQGAAQSLFEWVRYDEDGNPVTASLMDYLMPSAAEFPSFETSNTETPSPLNPLGAKGIGESGTIGSTPAIHNAVVDAVSHLGVQHIDMPTSPLAIWEAINKPGE
ncbi:MAG: xanthine dehydrogenase family protein molybdopterin-binding subunit [Actinomycetia bacterium]|nr:xanthine dehydrogenase family protein molybdopterin-binding subunit [Actinomycetes bacterium]